jgi:hypothetical protein
MGPGLRAPRNDGVVSQRCAAHSSGCGNTLSLFPLSRRRDMERREAPGICEAPWDFGCDPETLRAADVAAVSPQVGPVVRMGLRGPSRGARALRWRVCETRIRTLRLPALHRDLMRARLPAATAGPQLSEARSLPKQRGLEFTPNDRIASSPSRKPVRAVQLSAAKPRSATCHREAGSPPEDASPAGAADHPLRPRHPFTRDIKGR